jgi:hypothetical protein
MDNHSMGTAKALLQLAEGEEVEALDSSIANCLRQLSAGEQLEQILQLMQVLSQQHEANAEIMVAAWEYLARKELWKANPGFKSLQHCENTLNQETHLQGMRVQKDGIQARKTLQLNRIKAEWGSSLRDLIPARLLPKLFSYHFLRIMAGISTRFTVEEVIPLLEETIQSRLAAKGRLNDPTALRCDLQKIADMEQLLLGVPIVRARGLGLGSSFGRSVSQRMISIMA